MFFRLRDLEYSNTRRKKKISIVDGKTKQSIYPKMYELFEYLDWSNHDHKHIEKLRNRWEIIDEYVKLMLLDYSVDISRLIENWAYD